MSLKWKESKDNWLSKQSTLKVKNTINFFFCCHFLPCQSTLGKQQTPPYFKLIYLDLTKVGQTNDETHGGVISFSKIPTWKQRKSMICSLWSFFKERNIVGKRFLWSKLFMDRDLRLNTTWVGIKVPQC